LIDEVVFDGVFHMVVHAAGGAGSDDMIGELLPDVGFGDGCGRHCAPIDDERTRFRGQHRRKQRL
jgi:hypothetical protein